VPTLDIGQVTKAAPAAAVPGDIINHVVSIPVTGGTASWSAAQTSFRDQWSAGLALSGGVGAVTFSNWITDPVCTQMGASIVCTGGSIANGATATVTIPMLVTGCGLVTNNAEADPNNNITETNELNNTAVAATSVACDTSLSKIVSTNSVNTSGSAQNITYTITLVDVTAGATRVAPSSVSDNLPGSFIVQSVVVSAGDAGSCGASVGTNALTCTGVSGPEPVTITYVVQVPTSQAPGNYTNSATVTTPGDVVAGNNTDSVTVSVYPYDAVVNITDTADPVLSGNQYIYTVNVTNNSAGGFNTGAFFVQGGLQLRNTGGGLEGAINGVTAFADIATVTGNGGFTCLFPSPGVGASTERYSCSHAGLAAGVTETITVVVNATASEPDGFATGEVSLDAVLASTQPSPCFGGGQVPSCAPETSQFVETFSPPASMTANNRSVEFTDID
jgi:hypothetical protein